jgi:rRNA maturation endonuclease Nob1
MKILDSSGVINLRDKELEGSFMTVSEIVPELRDIQSRLKLEAAIEQRRVQFEEPSAKSIKAVEAVAEKNGVLAMLSHTDLKVLALAYEKKLPVVTDDYDIQNMCSLMGLKFETVSMRGITRTLKWSKKCSACGKVYSKDVPECEACGSENLQVMKKR